MCEQREESIPIRLAWLKHYLDEVGSRRVDYIIPSAPLDPNTVAAIYEVIGGLAKVRPLLIFCEIFRRTYLDLVYEINSIRDELSIDDLSNSSLKSLRRQCALQHRVTNFLNSAVFMIERGRGYADHSAIVVDLQEFEKARHRAYDEFRSYRLCYALRNYSQHSDLPFQSIDVSQCHTNDGWSADFRVTIYASRLKNAKRKLRDIVVNDYGGQVDLLPELDQYFKICNWVYFELIRGCVPYLMNGVALKDKLLASRPLNANQYEPVIWKGPLPAEDGSGSFDGLDFSLDELAMWEEAIARIKAESIELLNHGLT